jgi:hypothetical protein
MKINISPLWEKLGIADDIGLIQQIFDVYSGEESDIGEIVVINNSEVEKYVQQHSGICGTRNEKAIENLALIKAISPIEAGNLSFPYLDTKLGTNVYKVLINWEELKKYAGLLQDQEADEPWGKAKQKAVVREILQNLDKSSKTKEFTISEKNLGKYVDHVSIAHEIRGDDSPDRHIKLFETLKNLEKDGILKIHSIDYDFNASPTLPEDEIIQSDGYYGIDEDAYFYPAAHCKITLELFRSQSEEAILEKQISEQAIRPSGFTPRSILPVNPSAEKIFKSFSPHNYSFILKIISGILSLTDFSSDGKVHYKLQSPPGQLLINERSLLNRLNVEGLFSYYGEDGIFAIATLGNINTEVLRDMETRLNEALQHPKTIPENSTPDLTSRRGLEKKWDVLQSIWTVYESNSRPAAILVPVDAVAIKGRTSQDIDLIMEGLKNTGNFGRWERRDEYYNIEDINRTQLPLTFNQIKSQYTRLADEYEQSRTKNSRISVQQFSCGNIMINLDQAIMKYKANNPVEISPDNDEIQMLVFLMKNKGIVKKYIEIAKELNINCYHKAATNSDVAREVQFLRRDLATFLRKKVGMSDEEINRMIIVKKNTGYKLQCTSNSPKPH